MAAQACDRHLTFRNGSLRCALFPENKIPPAAFTEIAGPAGVGSITSEVKRSVASHEDVKDPRFAGRVADFGLPVAGRALWTFPGRIRALIRTL